MAIFSAVLYAWTPMRPKERQKPAPWRVYILCCADGTYYTGATNSIERRLGEHNRGTASRYTRSRRPVTLMASSGVMSRSEALCLEREIKRLPRAKKAAGLATKGYSIVRKYAKRKTALTKRKKESEA
ncbi:MAG TPA: GIY-YIG nuclease family protein [Smithellaceae bacterium]|nr:GIY-YIG nuclease family protein [Smithellaceae bacterium]